MFKTSAVIALALTVVCMGSLQAQTVKWSQSPDMVTGDGFISTTGYSAHVADDWLCLDGNPVVGVDWWGAYFNNVQVPINGFYIRVYTDEPKNAPTVPFSHPKDLLQEWYVTSYNEAAFGTRPAIAGHPAGSVFSYHADLTPSFNQTINNVYWLEIQADLAQPNRWYWWDSTDAWNDDAAQILPALYGDSNWHELFNTITSNSTNMAFRLTTVPEPSSIVGLLAGSLGLLGLIRGRKK